MLGSDPGADEDDLRKLALGRAEKWLDNEDPGEGAGGIWWLLKDLWVVFPSLDGYTAIAPLYRNGATSETVFLSNVYWHTKRCMAQNRVIKWACTQLNSLVLTSFRLIVISVRNIYLVGSPAVGNFIVWIDPNEHYFHFHSEWKWQFCTFFVASFNKQKRGTRWFPTAHTIIFPPCWYQYNNSI